jgi:hypothetical protein
MHDQRTYQGSKTVNVYDQVLDHLTRQNLYNYVANSLFRVSGYDNEFQATRSRQVYSKWTLSDLVNSGFLALEPIKNLLTTHGLDQGRLRQVRVNASSASEQNHIHSDQEGTTVLYWANMIWDLDWGGHLLIVDESMSDIRDVIAFRPGRLVIMDGSLPHLVSPPTALAEDLRFSLVLQFDREQNIGIHAVGK